MARVVALTGTPGTGKSSVAALLSAPPFSIPTVEVGDLERRQAPSPPRTPVVVDLRGAARVVRSLRKGASGTTVLVGHLSHLLPVHDVLLLRCRPSELARRLRARGLAERWVEENREAELLDVVLHEALRLRRRVFELDTTDLSPREVALWADRALRGKVPAGGGKVDWLALEPPKLSGRGLPRRRSSRRRPRAPTARQKRPRRSP